MLNRLSKIPYGITADIPLTFCTLHLLVATDQKTQLLTYIVNLVALERHCCYQSSVTQITPCMTYVDKLLRAVRRYLAKHDRNSPPQPARGPTRPPRHALPAEMLAEPDQMRKKAGILAMRLHSGIAIFILCCLKVIS